MRRSSRAGKGNGRQGKVMVGSSSSSRILSVFKPQNIHACQGTTLTWLHRVKKSTPWLLITVPTMTSLAKFHHGHHSQHYHHLCKAPVFNQHSCSLRLVNRLVSDFLLRLPLRPAVPSPLGLKVLPFHLPTAHRSFHPLCHVEVLRCRPCAPCLNAGPTMAMEQLIWMASPQDTRWSSHLRMLAAAANHSSDAPPRNSHVRLPSDQPSVPFTQVLHSTCDDNSHSPPPRPVGLCRTQTFAQLPSTISKPHTMFATDYDGIDQDEDNGQPFDERSQNSADEITGSAVHNPSEYQHCFSY